MCLFDISSEDLIEAKSQVILASELVVHAASTNRYTRPTNWDVETPLLPIKLGSGQRIQFGMIVTFNASMNETDGVASLLQKRYELIESLREDFG